MLMLMLMVMLMVMLLHNQGHLDAKFLLGLILGQGRGVRIDRAAALSLWLEVTATLLGLLPFGSSVRTGSWHLTSHFSCQLVSITGSTTRARRCYAARRRSSRARFHGASMRVPTQ